jgi:hypothetical protein
LARVDVSDDLLLASVSYRKERFQREMWKSRPMTFTADGFPFLRLILSPCISKYHHIYARHKYRKRQPLRRDTQSSTMPIHTRSGNVLHTAGDPNAPSNFFNPTKWTKPKKKDDDRTPIALFVVDEIPLQVNTCDAPRKRPTLSMTL